MSDYTKAWMWLGIPETAYLVSDGSNIGSIRTLSHLDPSKPIKEILEENDNAGMTFTYSTCENADTLNMKSYKARTLSSQ